MTRPDEYELTFPHSGQDDSDHVVVHRTGASGPGGSEVYADESGIVRAEISDKGEIRMIPTGGRQAVTRPTRVRPLE